MPADGNCTSHCWFVVELHTDLIGGFCVTHNLMSQINDSKEGVSLLPLPKERHLNLQLRSTSAESVLTIFVRQLGMQSTH